MQDLLDLIQRNQMQLEKQVFLCCFILIFAKTADVCCIFNNIDHLQPCQLLFLIKFSGHSRVIFADARSSLKFWVSYIARFIVNIRSVSRLFPRVFLIYNQKTIRDPENHLIFGSYYLSKSYSVTCLSWISCVGLQMNGVWLEIFRISIKATHQKALIFICFTFSIFLNNISISFSTVFCCWISEYNCPGGGVLARFFCPGVGVWTFFVPGGGEFALSEHLPREMVRLGIDWYITY